MSCTGVEHKFGNFTTNLTKFAPSRAGCPPERLLNRTVPLATNRKGDSLMILSNLIFSFQSSSVQNR